MEAERALTNRSDLYGFLFEAAPSDSAFLVAYEWINANKGGTVIDEQRQVTIQNENALDALLNATLWVRSGLSPHTLLGSNAEQATHFFKACRAPFMRNWLSEYSEIHGSQIRSLLPLNLPRN